MDLKCRIYRINMVPHIIQLSVLAPDTGTNQKITIAPKHMDTHWNRLDEVISENTTT